MAENYLQLALDGTNDLLAQFDAGFSVEMGSSLGFLARRHGGKPFAATRLSGGEKVLFSLAFRVKVNAMFASDVGLLVLDEPTAGVDEVNITCLERAFTKLRELSSSAGLQVIVVTHEQRLAPLFDHVHELSPPVVAGRRKK
jgi:DNA repair exonuclease SbcCD ATPase subunit